MAEITLADLLTWEPRLRLAAASADNGVTGMLAKRELTWAVTARALPPMLPLLRGGELVLLPRRVLFEAGITLPLLLRELAAHDVTGVVVEELGEFAADTAPAAPGAADQGKTRRPGPAATAVRLPVLVTDPIPPDFESDLNRLLTQRRGEIYRAGTELGRVLNTLTAAGADLGQVLAAAAAELSAPMAVLDSRANLLAVSGPEAATSDLPLEQSAADRMRLLLPTGDILLLGPIPEPRRAFVRLTADRVAVAVEAALVQAERQRPRGPARAAALAVHLTGDAADLMARAHALGLGLDTRYRVALAAPSASPVAVRRALSPLGVVDDAGTIDGASAFLIELPAGRVAVSESTVRTGASSASRPARAAPRRRTDAEPAQVQEQEWLALSQPAYGAAALPDATREARFVAALLASGLVPGPIARFDAVADLGAFRLLFRLWGTPELTAFVADALGDLAAHDRRGLLRQTLLAYLESGGSHVAAAAGLGIHRNTLAYRLKQITTLTGHDPNEPGQRLLLHLALLADGLPPAPRS